MQCHFLQCHFSMPFSESCWCFSNKFWQWWCGYSIHYTDKFQWTMAFSGVPFPWVSFHAVPFLQCHFSMPFFKSCWCFWQQTLMTAMQLHYTDKFWINSKWWVAFSGVAFSVVPFLRVPFSMPFFESCGCFWQQTLTMAMWLLLYHYPLHRW